MRIIRVITVVFGVLLLSGCGDQFWCGDNGCSSKKIAPTTSAQLNINPILKNIL